MRANDGYVGWLMRRYGVCRADAEDILQASLLRLVHDYRAKHPNASEAELQAYLEAKMQKCSTVSNLSCRPLLCALFGASFRAGAAHAGEGRAHPFQDARARLACE
jgi:hypothetical protein